MSNSSGQFRPPAAIIDGMKKLRSSLVDYDMALLKGIADCRGVPLTTPGHGEAVEQLAGALLSPAAVAIALAELAEVRAVAVKTFLINEQGLAADRAVIEQTPADDPAHSFSGVELSPGS